MKSVLAKVDNACKEYTDHEFVHASLLGVAGILTVITFFGPAILGA